MSDNDIISLANVIEDKRNFEFGEIWFFSKIAQPIAGLSLRTFCSAVSTNKGMSPGFDPKCLLNCCKKMEDADYFTGLLNYPFFGRLG